METTILIQPQLYCVYPIIGFLLPQLHPHKLGGTAASLMLGQYIAWICIYVAT